MATVDDVEVANASFPNVRQDLNDILEALATNFSADDEPTTTYPNQFWYETDTNLLYIRNEADDAWITLASINQTSGEWEVRTGVVQASDGDGILFKTDEGTTRLTIADSGQVSFENYSFPTADGSNGQALITDGSGNLSFGSVGGDKIEEGNSSVEVVDTGTGYVAVTVDGSETARFDANGRLGIGTTSPELKQHIQDGALSGRSAANANCDAVIEGTSDTGIQFFSSNQVQLRFGDAASTGAGSIIYEHSNNSLALNTNGNSAVTIDSSQNLKFNSGFGSVATAYGCRAWVNFNGEGTVAIRESGNVSSITDHAEGDYTVNFSTAMPDNEFAIVGGSTNNEIATVDSYNGISFVGSSYVTSSVRFRCIRWRFDQQNFRDSPVISLVVMR